MMKSSIHSIVVLLILGIVWVLGCQGTIKPTSTATNQPTDVVSNVESPSTDSASKPSPSNVNVTPETVTSTAISPEPTASHTLLPTETVLPSTTPDFPGGFNMGWLFAKGIQWYGWYELVAQDSQDGLLFDNQDGYHQYSSHELFNAVAETFLFEFSHYSNQMAFVPLPNSNELWLSDVTYQRPKKLLSVDPSGDGSNPLWGLRIVWSPDDRYLFLYHEAQLELNLIYNLSTEKLEPWYWQCDSIILSPQSGRLAPLCPRIPGIATEQAAYAIVEWSGEIWFTDEELGEPFLQPTPEELAFWEWSLNGEWLAYFDPNDPAGYLFIADAFGNVRQFFPGISVFNEPEGQKIRYFPSANNVFAWARNAPILLVEGYGQPEQPCPPYFTPFHDDDVPIWPCWQAINIDTGEIVWSQASLVENLILAGEEDTTGVAIRDIAIAPNGRAVAFHILDPYRNIIVDMQTARVTNLSFVYILIEQLYWADEP